MPRGDRTGPVGAGPMTGRAAGYCAGFGMPGYANYMLTRGVGAGIGRGRGLWGRGFGRGQGWRHCYYATGLPGWMRGGWYGTPPPYAMPRQEIDAETEKQGLRTQAEVLQSELDAINKRLAELETEAPAQ